VKSVQNHLKMEENHLKVEMEETEEMEVMEETEEMEVMEETEELLTFRRCLAPNSVMSHLSNSVV
jgi:hypothetical protein